MEKIIIFLFIQLTFILWLLYFYKSHSKIKLSSSRIAFYSSVFFYFSIIVLVIITKISLQNNLDSFDLNKDGFFSGNEITDAQEKALESVSSDTGLTFAPITGILYSLIYFSILYISLKIFRKEKPANTTC
jgi:hypothetical protein